MPELLDYLAGSLCWSAVCLILGYVVMAAYINRGQL